MQITDTILMVRPHHFGYNPQTAENNAFQSKDKLENKNLIQEKAQQEFDIFVKTLNQHGIETIIIEDANDGLERPDAVFPNNWISFHQEGMTIIYPMYAPSRRIERREDVIQMMQQRLKREKLIRFTHYESENRFLEGTGSMILDREHKIVYACLSPRTDEQILEEYCETIGYKKVAFDALDEQGGRIYHTNVMMALGETFAVISLATIRNKTEREKLLQLFKETKKELIDISLEQVNSFAGNMLQVRNKKGETFLVMSSQAYKALTPKQIQQIETHTNILHSPVPTIEKYGGGSVRCMMAEVF